MVGIAVASDVKQAGAPLALAQRLLPDEVLLRVAGHLSWRARHHIVPADAPPVALQNEQALRWPSWAHALLSLSLSTSISAH